MTNGQEAQGFLPVCLRLAQSTTGTQAATSTRMANTVPSTPKPTLQKKLSYDSTAALTPY